MTPSFYIVYGLFALLLITAIYHLICVSQSYKLIGKRYQTNRLLIVYHKCYMTVNVRQVLFLYIETRLETLNHSTNRKKNSFNIYTMYSFMSQVKSFFAFSQCFLKVNSCCYTVCSVQNLLHCLRVVMFYMFSSKVK